MSQRADRSAGALLQHHRTQCGASCRTVRRLEAVKGAVELIVDATDEAADVDSLLRSRLRLAMSGVLLAWRAGPATRTGALGLAEAALHLEAVVERSPVQRVTEPTRDAWQLVVAANGGELP